jgi:hypothetical protein
LPTLATPRAKSARKTKQKSPADKPRRGSKSESVKQMTLGFEKPSRKTGKKHGAKKAKK